MNNLNEHINRMKQLFGAQHGIIKPLVSEQSPFEDEFDDFINKYSDNNDYGASDDVKNNTPQGSSQYKKDKPLFGDEGNEMINKPGSGRKLQGSVNMVIKNKTTGKTETPYNVLGEDENWAEIAQRKLAGEFVDFDVRHYGYYVIAEAVKENYKEGDGLTIEFDVPFVVNSLEADGPQNNVSLINRTVSGSKTNIKVEAKIVVENNFMFAVRGVGKTDKPSPFESGQFTEFFFAVRFRR
jgi:hypothetical protein